MQKVLNFSSCFVIRPSSFYTFEGLIFCFSPDQRIAAFEIPVLVVGGWRRCRVLRGIKMEGERTKGKEF